MTLHEPSWDKARAAAHAAAQPRSRQMLAISECMGLTLASPLIAKANVPGFDTAMMDGWAVAGPAPWTIVGQVLAGSTGHDLLPGTAVGIATGAPVPSGADCILRREWGDLEAGTLSTSHSLHTGLDIRIAGDEAKVGDVLLTAGTRVTPPVVGLAALVGVDVLEVHEPATVGALVMGDELITSGVPSFGEVRDALGVQLLAWTHDFACKQLPVTYVEDTLDATIASIRDCTADVMFTTGGTARGPVDHLHSALDALGAELIVDEVQVRPGHPMLLAALPDGRFLIGLPGNPLAAITGYLTLGVPLLSALSGRALPELDSCITSEDINAPHQDRRIIPAHKVGDVATPTSFWGSAMLRGIAESNCMLVSAPGGTKAGERVGVLPLPW